MRRKILITLASVLLLTGVFLIAARLGAFTPDAPQGWTQVHTGMARAEVLRLAGAPHQSGWPEKVCETWQRSGAVCHQRLFVWYRGERVISVWQGTWLRGYGYFGARKEYVE